MRKYPKVTGYWLYVHRTPDNQYYVGVSQQQVHLRWRLSNYRTKSLEPYIDQYGWNNIEHLVVKDGLTKEQALYWEERFIKLYSELGCLINKIHSGNCTADMNAYKRQYNQQPEAKEYHRQYNQQYNQLPEVKEYKREYDQQPEIKVYKRVASYNRYHTPIETPLEAKKKFLETGYIPSYIKSDDLV